MPRLFRSAAVLSCCCAALLLTGAASSEPSATTPPAAAVLAAPAPPVDWSGLTRAIEAKAAAELWYSTVVWQQVEAANARAARAPRPQRHASAARYGSGACGGSLPSCAVLECESGGNLTAQNPRSTASGKWQILDSTWNGYGGYSSAADAPESVQDERAEQIYAGGAGRSQWVC